MLNQSATQQQLPDGIRCLERGWLSSNNVVLWDDDEVNLIDCGYVAHAEQTLLIIQQSWPNRALTRIINTHLHSDHCGGNALLQSHFPLARTLIPVGQFQDVIAWNEDKLPYRSTGQRCPRFRVDAAIEPGDQLRLAGHEWVAVAAPGHDPYAIMLWNASHRVLITADALWENGFGIVFPELNGVSAFEDVGTTLDTIERLMPNVVIPGHGSVVFDVPAALLRARSRLKQFQTNPAAHTHHALKALLKFLLLDRKEASWTELHEWIIKSSLMKDALDFGVANDWQITDAEASSKLNARSPQQEWLAAAIFQLAKVGALRINGDVILDA